MQPFNKTEFIQKKKTKMIKNENFIPRKKELR